MTHGKREEQARLNITGDYLEKLIKLGLPYTKPIHARLFDPAAVDEWLAATGRRGAA